MKNDQFWEKCNNRQVRMAYASWQTDAINDWSLCSIDGSSSMEQGFLFFSPMTDIFLFCQHPKAVDDHRAKEHDHEKI